MVDTKILKTPLIVRVSHKVNTRLLFFKEKNVTLFLEFFSWFGFGFAYTNIAKI